MLIKEQKKILDTGIKITSKIGLNNNGKKVMCYILHHNIKKVFNQPIKK